MRVIWGKFTKITHISAWYRKNLLATLSSFCVVFCSIWAPFWRRFDIDWIYITDLQPLKDRLSELEVKIGKIGILEAENEKQTSMINQLKAETENQTLMINQLKAETENQNLTINQLKAENFNLHQMLQDRNDSYGNLNFLLSLFFKGFWSLPKLLILILLSKSDTGRFTAIKKSGSWLKGEVKGFDKSIVNIGHNFDLSTGVFKAPIEGVYWFSFSGHTSYVVLNIRKNGQNTFAISISQDSSHTSSWSMRLSKNDEISLYVSSLSNGLLSDNNRYTVFSGLFIRSLWYFWWNICYKIFS